MSNVVIHNGGSRPLLYGIYNPYVRRLGSSPPSFTASRQPSSYQITRTSLNEKLSTAYTTKHNGELLQRLNSHACPPFPNLHLFLPRWRPDTRPSAFSVHLSQPPPCASKGMQKRQRTCVLAYLLRLLLSGEAGHCIKGFFCQEPKRALPAHRWR